MRYEERISTRLDPGVDRRLRLYAALRGLKINEAINTALDRHLPSAEELVTEMAQGVSRGKGLAPGHGPTSRYTSERSS